MKKRLLRLRETQRTKKVFVWKRVKTACIGILLVCNVILLAVFAGITGYDKIMSMQTRKHMDAILAQRGVLCGTSVYHTLEDCPQAYTLRADPAIQQAFAQAFLTGTITMRAEKGNTMVWTGDNGEVRWASSGKISANVELPYFPQPVDNKAAQRMICDLFQQAGIKLNKEQVVTTQDGETEYTVTIQQQVKHIELLGCQITVHISANNVISMEGMWCTGDAEPLTIRALESYSPEQVIFQFLQARTSATQMISVQPVYVFSDKSGGRFTAIPCWRFSTDQGDFVLNILTGDVVASADLTQIGDAPTQSEDTDTTDIAEPLEPQEPQPEELQPQDSQSEELQPENPQPEQQEPQIPQEDMDIPWNE